MPQHLTWTLDCDAILLDNDLKVCSHAAFRAFICLGCIAKSGYPPGWLTLKTEQPIPDEVLAEQCRMKIAEWRAARDELLMHHILIKGQLKGALFLARMVKDEATTALAREGGRRGGNPALLPGLAPPPESPPPAVTLDYVLAKRPDHLKSSPEVKAALCAYWDSLTQRGRQWATPREVTLNYYQLRRLTPEEAVHWIDTAARRKWGGFYPPSRNGQTGAGGGAVQPGVPVIPREWIEARDGTAGMIWDAKERGEGGADLRRAMQVARDKWGRVPRFDGADAVEKGIELALHNRRAGRG
jgi:hypothetical protein